MNVIYLIWRVRACRDNALACLNELVTDALTLVPECLAYMRQIKNPEVFRFCAIPQVTASSRWLDWGNFFSVRRGGSAARCCLVTAKREILPRLDFFLHGACQSSAVIDLIISSLVP